MIASQVKMWKANLWETSGSRPGSRYNVRTQHTRYSNSYPFQTESPLQSLHGIEIKLHKCTLIISCTTLYIHKFNFYIGVLGLQTSTTMGIKFNNTPTVVQWCFKILSVLTGALLNITTYLFIIRFNLGYEMRQSQPFCSRWVRKLFIII